VLDRLLKALISFRYSVFLQKRIRPVSDIKQALSRLKNSVGRLEGSMQTLELAMAGKQRDMFAEAPKAINGPLFDTTVISQRLDKAIKKVEELLET
jgi:hypothetical protein